MKNKLKKILSQKKVWIFFIILLIGIFFRVYNFSDYLRFNPDQARDARIVKNAIEGKENLPLLGPQAGGTNFRLGPSFYYFEFVSAKIFGTSPDRMAYPDLFFSILSIPLLYLFLRKYFNPKTVLLCVGLFAVSFFAVKYSRFAWNPNSIPFFSLLFLFSLNEMGKTKEKIKWIWPVLLGLSLGIGIQLHSLLLFSFPIVTAIYFIWLFFRKNQAWKKIWIVFVVVILLNIPQVINEVTNIEKNSRAFIVAFDTKASRDASFAEKLRLNVICHIQANGFILSSIGNDSKCDLLETKKEFKKNKKDPAKTFKNAMIVSNVILSIVFSLGGIILLVYFWKKEKSFEKKNFLGILLLYSAVLFVILTPLALEISMRFFLPLVFIPFVFVGLWIKFVREYFGEKYVLILIILAILLATLNVCSLKNRADYLAGKNNKSQDFEEVTLSEVEFMANFIKERAPDVNNIHIDGKASELFKITKSIRYFTDETGLEVKDLKKNSIIGAEDKVFAIDVVNDPTGQNEAPKGAVSSGSFNRVRIYEMGK